MSIKFRWDFPVKLGTRIAERAKETAPHTFEEQRHEFTHAVDHSSTVRQAKGPLQGILGA
jgi:hypothetical protein